MQQFVIDQEQEEQVKRSIRLQNVLQFRLLISHSDIIKEAFRATSSSLVVINVSAASQLRSNIIEPKMLIRQATWCQNLKQSVHNSSGFPLLAPSLPFQLCLNSPFGFIPILAFTIWTTQKICQQMSRFLPTHLLSFDFSFWSMKIV